MPRGQSIFVFVETWLMIASLFCKMTVAVGLIFAVDMRVLQILFLVIYATFWLPNFDIDPASLNSAFAKTVFIF